MRYGSVCSGIEAATVAWHPLGWTPAFFSEIEAFPRAVLAHHYPEVPLHGDFTTIGADEYGPIDLLVGGTPCQSFSVAGLRGGLADDRGNLALEFLKLAQRTRPRWLVWENVPGVLSSDGGRDFGSILGGLGVIGYGFAYRVLDAQFFGVPQRRRRVFVVGYLGDWRRAAAVLFERHGLQGHPAPRRKKGKDIAGTIGASAGDRSRDNVGESVVAHAFDARQSDVIQYGDRTGPPDTDGSTTGVLCFTAKDYGADAEQDLSPTLRAGGFTGSHANGGVMPAVAFQTRGSNVDVGDISGTIGSNADRASGSAPMFQRGSAVRRLTPRECERLQGFPDDYTLITMRGKPAADGPRYKALGNSMAVPVMAHIGHRIQMVEDLCRKLESERPLAEAAE